MDKRVCIQHHKRPNKTPERYPGDQFVELGIIDNSLVSKSVLKAFARAVQRERATFYTNMLLRKRESNPRGSVS